MNDDLPKLTEAGFELLSSLVKAHGQAKRITLNPYDDNKYEIDGYRTPAATVNRLVADGYLANLTPELRRAMFYDLTKQAIALSCPKCHGSGLVSRAEAYDGEQGCPQCSSRGIIAPGTDYTPPYQLKPKTPRKPKARAPITFDPSPTRDGVYWLGLDDSDAWVEGSPFLVKVSREMMEFGLGEQVSKSEVTRLKFLTGRFDEESLDGGLDQLKHGTVRSFSRRGNIGGFIATSRHCEYRMHWLGDVTAPRLPTGIDPAESCTF